MVCEFTSLYLTLTPHRFSMCTNDDPGYFLNRRRYNLGEQYRSPSSISLSFSTQYYYFLIRKLLLLRIGYLRQLRRQCFYYRYSWYHQYPFINTCFKCSKWGSKMMWSILYLLKKITLIDDVMQNCFCLWFFARRAFRSMLSIFCHG